MWKKWIPDFPPPPPSTIVGRLDFWITVSQLDIHKLDPCRKCHSGAFEARKPPNEYAAALMKADNDAAVLWFTFTGMNSTNWLRLSRGEFVRQF